MEMNKIWHLHTIWFCPDNNGSGWPKALLSACLQLTAVASGQTKCNQRIFAYK